MADVPERLIGDKACDSDRLEAQLLQEYGTVLIAPNKVNRRVPTQDGRPLRRYVRRWKIERLFAWLFNFRRLVVRIGSNAIFQAFCAVIWLGLFVKVSNLLLEHRLIDDASAV